jgi:peptide/nickel transport system substrate-binding protein
MDTNHKLSRRDFLRVSAMVAVSTVAAACASSTQTPQTAGTTGPSGGATSSTTAAGGAGSSTTSAPAAATTGTGGANQTAAPESGASGATSVPLKASGSFKESPKLAEQVKANKLPPVEQRLPQNPYVIPHAWVTPGKYGGTLQLTMTDLASSVICNYMYAHSILRLLKDGQEIGPGLAESWEHNADTSQWTFHFRKGLKWSDGQPWTVGDIMYWWEDIVLNEEHPTGPPDECKSAKGTPATFKKIDDYTLQLTFDVPAPLTAARIAMYTNRGNGNGAEWMQPRHYAQQFHPKYNKSVTAKNWYELHDRKLFYFQNPESPTMTAWRLVSYKESQRAAWERNPYYWCVAKDGSQLPYLDGLNISGVQDPEVQKLGFLDGKVDFVLGSHTTLTLADVSALKQAQSKSKLEVRFWDSGSGTGSIFFLNYDYKDPKMRALIRKPEFRKALSLSFKRDELQKTIYYNTGERTTGTYSPKAIEYHAGAEGKQAYASWRDSAVAYDPERAKQLLAQAGLKQQGGKWTFADGSPVSLRIEYKATAGHEHLAKNEILARDWTALGLDVKQNPVPPTAFSTGWAAGDTMSTSDWENSASIDHLTQAAWIIPIEPSRWAPLEGQFYAVRGTSKENAEKDVDPYKRKPPRMAPEAGGPVDRLWKLYDQARVEPDPLNRNKLVFDMIKIHVQDGPFIIGTVANTPVVVLVREDLKNVPKREELYLGGFVNPWLHPTPGVYSPEIWYFDDPSAHTA